MAVRMAQTRHGFMVSLPTSVGLGISDPRPAIGTTGLRPALVIDMSPETGVYSRARAMAPPPRTSLVRRRTSLFSEESNA
jgi:hypothetical protein